MIICAAIKVQIEGLDHETIVPCFRHGNGLEIVKDMQSATDKKIKVVDYGFINHKNQFLDREEAFAYVKEIGQCNTTQRWYWEDRNQFELYSEDLY